MSDDAGGTASPVARAYDRWADTYDTALNLTRDLDARVLREAPLELPGADVVEIGCGTGKNTAWLAAWARGVTALDFSSEMLARARERVRGEHVRFVRHDAREPWPVGDASADVVTVNLVLEHVADLAPVFAEGLRVLRPGGRFFLCELHPYRQWRGGQAHFVVRGRERRSTFPHTSTPSASTSTVASPPGCCSARWASGWRKARPRTRLRACSPCCSSGRTPALPPGDPPLDHIHRRGTLRCVIRRAPLYLRDRIP